MKLSIIIIGHNSWHFLEKNLVSLDFLQSDPDTEIIYVDNGSSDGSVENIKRLYPSIKIIENKNNKGISKARNQGLRIALGRYLWLLDSDTEVSEQALNEMLDFMEKTEDAGICGCKMYGQDGTVQVSCRKFPSFKSKLKAAIHIIGKKIHCNLFDSSIRKENYNMEAIRPFIVDYVIGASQLIRREAFEKAGELDEKIFYGPEDADFCFRVKKTGYNVYYLPQTSIYHAYQRASSTRIFSRITYEHVKGLIYYFRKYK
jgi:GT2 family glycosyltransferase